MMNAVPSAPTDDELRTAAQNRKWSDDTTTEQRNTLNAACGDLAAQIVCKTCIRCGALFSGRRCLVCKKASDAAWKAANVERRKVVDALWVKNNPAKVNATKQKYALNNPEKRRGSKSKWQKNNSERMLIHGHNRRAKVRGQGKKLSFGLKEKLFKLQKGRCACCKADLLKNPVHMDHIYPVALDGANSDENMQLLCGPCNQSKSAKHPIDFMQSRGFLL